VSPIFWIRACGTAVLMIADSHQAGALASGERTSSTSCMVHGPRKGFSRLIAHHGQRLARPPPQSLAVASPWQSRTEAAAAPAALGGFFTALSPPLTGDA
jgi:hypothetical protein